MAPRVDGGGGEFSRYAEILGALAGGQARLVDRPRGAGAGRVDPGDTLEIIKGRSTRRVRLGEGRFHDARFRQLVVQAAHALADSGAEFSGQAATDRANLKLWTMGYGGRLQVRRFLRGGIEGSPARALKDIFANGEKYAFECATAMMVIYHRAILDLVGDKEFDEMFKEPNFLRFFRWDLKDDDYLAIERMKDEVGALTPGSHYYFMNPDASPENSAFRGENVIYLGKDAGGERLFYAHGIIGASGKYLVTEREIKDTLRSLRRPGARVEPRLRAFSYSLDASELLERIRQDGP